MTRADRYRKIAGRFTAVARDVAPVAWDNPAPCEGWAARDVVRHLVEWFPPFIRDGAGVALPAGPSVDEDPVGAWTTLSDAVQALLDAPASSARRFSHGHAGDHDLDVAVDMFFTNDVFIHTWDLARAAGVDETLDPDEVAAMLAAMEPFDDVLRASGQYGPRVAVPEDADPQTKLIAFTGRRP